MLLFYEDKNAIKKHCGKNEQHVKKICKQFRKSNSRQYLSRQNWF